MFEKRNPFRRAFTGGLALGAFSVPILAAGAMLHSGDVTWPELSFMTTFGILAGGISGLIWGAAHLLLYRLVPVRLQRYEWIKNLIASVPIVFVFFLSPDYQKIGIATIIGSAVLLRLLIHIVFPVISRSYSGTITSMVHFLLVLLPLGAGLSLQWTAPPLLTPAGNLILAQVLYLAGLIEAFFRYRDWRRRLGKWTRGPAVLASPPLAAFLLLISGLCSVYARAPWHHDRDTASPSTSTTGMPSALLRPHPGTVLVTMPSLPSGSIPACTPVGVIPSTDIPALALADAMSVATGCHIPARLFVAPDSQTKCPDWPMSLPGWVILPSTSPQGLRCVPALQNTAQYPKIHRHALRWLPLF